MFEHQTLQRAVTPTQARDRIRELETERVLASKVGLAENDSYMRDLEAELETWHRRYVISAVTEIATLRAEMFGAETG